jgi:hypothetical protein
MTSIGQIWQLCWLMSVMQFRLRLIASLPKSSQGGPRLVIALCAPA